MRVLLLLMVLLFALPLSRAAADYNRGDGEATRWKDADRSSHWSSKGSYGGKKHSDLRNNKRFIHPNKHRRHFIPSHRFNKFHPVIIYRQKTWEPPPQVEKETVRLPSYIPVPIPPSPMSCAGDVVYLRNNTTGEVTIKYVSPAGEC